MAILCIGEKVWTLLVGKIETLATSACQLERKQGPRSGDEWTNPVNGQKVLSFVLITTEANAMMGKIHN